VSKATGFAIHVTSHAVGLIAYRLTPDNHVEIANMTYTRGGRTSIRVPMGTGEPGEDLLDTLYRETVEEIAQNAKQFWMTPLSDFPFVGTLHRDQHYKEGNHLKAFYVAEVKGELRSEEMLDGDEILGQIVWTEAEELLHLGRDGHQVFFTHRGPILRALELLSKIQQIGTHYEYCLGKASAQNEIPHFSQIEIDAIKRYMSRI